MKRSAFTMIELVFIIVILGILGAIVVLKMAASREDAKFVALKTDFGTIKQAMAAMVMSQGAGAINSFSDAVAINPELWGAVEPSGTQGFGAFTDTPLQNATAIATRLEAKNSTGGMAASRSCVSMALRTKMTPAGRSDMATSENYFIPQGQKYLHIFIWNSSECQKHFGKAGASVIPLDGMGVKN